MSDRRRLEPSKSTVIRNVADDIKLAQKVMKEDRIAEAYALLRNIEGFIETLDEESRATALANLNGHASIAHIREKGERLESLRALMNDRSHWNSWNTRLGPHQDVTLFISKLEPEGQYHFKTDGYLRNVSLIEASAAILENSLHRFWMPLCTRGKTLDILSAYRRVIRLNFDFVLLKKTATLDVRADILPDGSLLLTYEPWEDQEGQERHYLPRNKAERMDLRGCVHLQDIDVLETEEKNELADLVSFLENRHHLDVDAAHADAGYGPPLSASVKKAQLRAQREEVDLISEEDDYREEDEPVVIEGNNPANTTHRGRKKAKPRGSTSSAGSWTESEQKEIAQLQRSPHQARVVKVQAMFLADLKIDFIPDWIFNLGLRSSVAMFIPMLQHQAQLFLPTGQHHGIVRRTDSVYSTLSARLADLGIPTTVDVRPPRNLTADDKGGRPSVYTGDDSQQRNHSVASTRPSVLGSLFGANANPLANTNANGGNRAIPPGQRASILSPPVTSPPSNASASTPPSIQAPAGNSSPKVQFAQPAPPPPPPPLVASNPPSVVSTSTPDAAHAQPAQIEQPPAIVSPVDSHNQASSVSALFPSVAAVDAHGGEVVTEHSAVQAAVSDHAAESAPAVTATSPVADSHENNKAKPPVRRSIWTFGTRKT